MAQSAFNVRMESQLKKEFSSMCEDFGMPVSTAITLFAKAVVREHRIPFEIRSDIPNSVTAKTIELAEQGKELHGPYSTVDELKAALDA
jgi:DNA-damage-inducible protein J